MLAKPKYSFLALDWFFESCFEQHTSHMVSTKEEKHNISIYARVCLHVLLMEFVEIALTLSIETCVTKQKGATNGYTQAKLNNT